MDPVTQMSIGAAAAALVARRSDMRLAVVVGALAGGAPDLDVLIRSDTDPLLALEYHRHFTHALVVAPLIGLIVAGLFRALFFWKDWPFHRIASFAVLGAITHGLIDACTSYGTLLYWPFHSHRESWDIISIIDPIFTIPLFLLVVIGFAFRIPSFAQVALALCLCYLCLGMYQRSQAAGFAKQLALDRGHSVEELSVRPSFANIVLWRIVYRSGDSYFVDAVRILPFTPPVLYRGAEVAAYEQDPAIQSGSKLEDDIARFRFFSQGYLYKYPEDSSVAGDLRYAMFPDSITPLWGIRLDPSKPDQHVSLEYFRDPSGTAFARLWDMISGLPVDPVN